LQADSTQKIAVLSSVVSPSFSTAQASPIASVSSVAPVALTPTTELPSSSAAYLNNPPPTYPPQSRRLGEQGIVKWRVLIGIDGKASEPVLAQSSGFARLDEAAKQAVLTWRYVPGKRAGVAEAMRYVVPIHFN
jgi:protein TonB